MKHAYLLLLIAGLFAAGCKKDKKSDNPPSPETRIYGNWKEDMSLIQTTADYVPGVFFFSPNMSYTLHGSMGPKDESGAYTVSRTGNPDSCVIVLKPNGGRMGRTLEVKIVAIGQISIRSYGQFFRLEY